MTASTATQSAASTSDQTNERHTVLDGSSTAAKFSKVKVRNTSKLFGSAKAKATTVTSGARKPSSRKITSGLA